MPGTKKMLTKLNQRKQTFEVVDKMVVFLRKERFLVGTCNTVT